MITELLLGLVGVILDAIVFLLPTVTTPYMDSLDSMAASFGGKLHTLDSWVPISELVVALGWIAGVYLPARYLWIMSMWLWTRIPFLGGGG